MSVKYTDVEIAQLINEKKPLPPNYQRKLQLRERGSHRGTEIDVVGNNGNQFRLILRQSIHNPLDFSIILAVLPPGTNQLFRLLRLNGKGHPHTNSIEGNNFYEFHIHRATERYQERGFREDGYAEVSDAFYDMQSALEYMLRIGGFQKPRGPQLELFGERK